MDQLKKYWENVEKAKAVFLATAAKESVTMRTVSPVYYKDAILIYTNPESQKYKQLKENPYCCIAAGGCFMEAKPEFLGRTMSDENASLREIYAKKFNDAFDENDDYDIKTTEFILLKPIRIKGWNFENGVPTSPFEYDF